MALPKQSLVRTEKKLGTEENLKKCKKWFCRVPLSSGDLLEAFWHVEARACPFTTSRGNGSGSAAAFYA